MGIDNPLHLAFLAIVALLVLGPKRLPELARTLGNGMREFRQAISTATENAMAAPVEVEVIPPVPEVHEPVSPIGYDVTAAPVAAPAGYDVSVAPVAPFSDAPVVPPAPVAGPFSDAPVAPPAPVAGPFSDAAPAEPPAAPVLQAAVSVPAQVPAVAPVPETVAEPFSVEPTPDRLFEDAGLPAG